MQYYCSINGIYVVGQGYSYSDSVLASLNLDNKKKLKREAVLQVLQNELFQFTTSDDYMTSNTMCSMCW